MSIDSSQYDKYQGSDLEKVDLEYSQLTENQLAEKAVDIATKQIMACYEFKKKRLEKIDKYWRLYDGKVEKKLRQLFNVPIPVFAGMIDTLNAQYDTPIRLNYKEGDPSDYFKVQKINGAFDIEVMNTATNSKWDSKLRMARKQAIMNGRAILEYNVSSDPDYYSELRNINLKDFNFQPHGGLYLEEHLFAGVENIEKTKHDLLIGAKNGTYDKDKVREMITTSAQSDYLPGDNHELSDKLSRFKPLGLDADNNSYVGQTIYKLASHILTINGVRYYLFFDPWTKKWLRFEKWKDINSSGLYPWVTFATHEDSENFLSKSYADDLYPASDAIVAMFNQELTNREKRNFGARAYDKDMFKDVRKLDDAMHRPDALVPADTKQGSKRIAEGIYEFKVGELSGTVNLIDWISGTLGRNTGATDLSQGSVDEVSKKASVTFAEQKSVSKRIGWGSQPFQDMMSDLGKRYLYGLKDHMPSKMAIRLLGENGWDWDEITRLDLNTKKDVDILIQSTEQEIKDSEIKAKKRSEALSLLANSQNINTQKRDEEILRSVGEYSDEDIADFLDVKTYSDRKSIAKASEAIQAILSDKEPEMWFGATIAFMEKIIEYASDKRSTLGDKFKKLMDYAMQHSDIVRNNIDRAVAEQTRLGLQRDVLGNPGQGEGGINLPEQPQAENPGVPGGVSRAISIAENAS